ncbi:hypothetical protein GGR50DRAFT_678233 [Xylaria sp. CBS 124048]|nr:hypothetical protein GGR50DRAFT_678233 [Xylaria sp. CBS 124048]
MTLLNDLCTSCHPLVLSSLYTLHQASNHKASSWWESDDRPSAVSPSSAGARINRRRGPADLSEKVPGTKDIGLRWAVFFDVFVGVCWVFGCLCECVSVSGMWSCVSCMGVLVGKNKRKKKKHKEQGTRNKEKEKENKIDRKRKRTAISLANTAQYTLAPLPRSNQRMQRRDSSTQFLIGQIINFCRVAQ